MGMAALAPLLAKIGIGAAVSPAVAGGVTSFATAGAPTLASTFAPALATSAAGPAAQSVAAAKGIVASQAAAGSKAALGTTLAKGAMAVAPSAISALASKQPSQSGPKNVPGVDTEAASAIERDRLRRQASGSRASILTGPTGAPGRGMVGRTILSGG